MQGKNDQPLEDYVLGRTLGRGTFASVKFATHRLTKEKVAVKLINKLKLIEPEDMERLRRELKIMQTISHPHIVQMYEVLETPRDVFIVLEFASGGELLKYISTHQRVREAEACRFFQQSIAGLEYLHSLGIAHRDLKPENLLLDHHKNIKIADFGLSNYYVEGTRLNTACGSPCYAAPEKIAGRPYDAAKADLWSMGVILYTMLVGSLPFDDANTSKLFKKIQSGYYYMPDFLSPNCKDCLRSLLQINPAARPGFAKLKSLPWFETWKQEIPPGLTPGIVVPVDINILKQLREYEIDIEVARKCVEENQHNPITAAYYLLVRKHLASGGNIRTTTAHNVVLPTRGRLVTKARNMSQQTRISSRDSQRGSIHSPFARPPFQLSSRASVKHSLTPKRRPMSNQLGLNSNWSMMRRRNRRRPSVERGLNYSLDSSSLIQTK
jgi:5'-AMP-activated protein kinase catalytic alpha subunit